jgi:tricorn protease
MKQIFFLLALVAAARHARAQVPETLLLRQPTLSNTHVAFSYGGDLWVAQRDGSQPRRLTVDAGQEALPVFSPDGRWIAFTGTYDNNADVYVISVDGGTPRRLTFHPASELVRGWSPDGQRVLFASNQASSVSRFEKLFTVPTSGGLPTELPIPSAFWASYAPDGQSVAYSVLADAFGTWKRYRGGRTTPIFITQLQTLDAEPVPHVNASDVQPVWVGNQLYFLSDRDRTMNVHAYDRATKAVRAVTRHTDFDVKSLSSSGTELIYEQGGRLHILNPGTGQTQTLRIQIAPEVLALRPGYRNVAKFIRNAHISPTGVRAVVEARGDIFTVPLKKGDWRNLTQTDSVHERGPVWSPDGSRIAYFSDASGEYQLMLRDQQGLKPAEAISLSDQPTFFNNLQWSPDGKALSYQDKKLNLWYLPLATKKPVRVATDTYGPNSSIESAWSPDGRWMAYTKKGDNRLNALYLYELASGRSTEVTDGKSDVGSPVFSFDGKYLLFSASTNTGIRSAWLDMTSYDRNTKQNLYLVVLSKTEPSPFLPESDEEKVTIEPAAEADAPEKPATKPSDKKKTTPAPETKPAPAVVKLPTVRIDLDGIGQRILALPVGAGTLTNLQAAEGGRIFYHDRPASGGPGTLQRFDFKERKAEAYLTGVLDYVVSADGKKVLYAAPGDQFGIVDATAAKVSPGDGKLNTAALESYIDPHAEWKQMLTEFYRIERDYFYVPNLHGADWPAIRKKYEVFLPHVAHRADLNYLIGEMMGEMVVGHNYVSGGDFGDRKSVGVGLLGADYELSNGRYRFRKVYSGENWNPDLRAPLTEPGVQVKAGEYLLAVNGKPLTGTDNIYQLFENQVGRQVTLLVNDKPSEAGARRVVVVPIGNESGLRQMDWVESNRRLVDKLTNGKVAYVYLPNTSSAGYEYFNRYYYSQLDKEGVIIDERFNGGGFVADYILDMLNRPLLSYWSSREGKPFTSPGASIYGPKVMIVNESAGSGGDFLPWAFRERKMGTIVGKRTWGGLVGISGYPALLDGGSVTSPSFGIYSPDGKWIVENAGVAPDIEVDMDPKSVAAGNDPQLLKAIEVVLDQLRKTPVPVQAAPAPPNRVGE